MLECQKGIAHFFGSMAKKLFLNYKKIIIKNLPTLLALSLLFLIAIENCTAQESSKSVWKKHIILHYGYPLGSNNWEYSHPSFSGSGGSQVITETGSFRSKSIFSGQFELSKGYYGFSAGTGVIPAELQVDKNEDLFNFNSLFLEIEGVFFPLKNSTTNMIPLVKTGAGGVVSFGDLDNTALFVSFGGGVRTFLTNSFGVSLMFKGRYFTYNEVPLTESILGDIKFTDFTVQLGVMYVF